MSTYRPILKTPPAGAVLLGRFAVWFGAVVFPIYLAVFALLLTEAGGRAAAIDLRLTPLLPEVGLALSGLGWLLARGLKRPAPSSCLTAWMLNAVSLAMAVLLPYVRRG